MINNLIYIYRLFPKSIWKLTLLQILFVARTTFFTTNRTVGDYSVASSSSSAIVFLVIILSIYVILKNYRYFRQANRIISKLVIFYLVCLGSIAWAGVHIVIIFKALEVFCNIYLMYIIASKIGNTRLLLIYIIVLSTIMTYMDVINSMRLHGFGFHHTNSYSMSAMIGFLLCLQAKRYNLLSSKETNIFMIPNLLAILGGTSSATYISLIAGLILIYSSNKKGINFGKILFVSFITVIIYHLFSEIIFEFIFQGKSQEDIETGTGRSAIFEASINSWRDSPILGHGYIIGERNLGEYGLGINVLSTHNSYLSALVDTGIVGLFFFLNYLISWVYNLLKKSSKDVYATILLPIVIACSINCLSFPAIGADWNYVGSLIFLMYIMTNLYMNNNTIKS